MLKANDELYEEAQRLSDIEAKWQLEKEQLEGELAKLSRQLEYLDKTSSVSQVLAENHSHTVEQAWSQTQFLSSFLLFTYHHQVMKATRQKIFSLDTIE